MTNPQEIAYPEGYDYTAGSPHLKHRKLRARVDASLVQEVARIRADRGRCRALEIGAGHGSFTAVLRRAGAEVTVTEMSGASAARLERVFSGDTDVRVVHDPDATWVDGTTDRFDLVVAISVLHHIPDYLSAVSRYADITEPGGAFISWQDPMWYPRLSKGSLLAARASYFAWRFGQGNFKRGFGTRVRRIRGVLDEAEVSDMSEYHVVRNGVDEQALQSLLRARYAETELRRYWSTQADILQRAGERLGINCTFSLSARGRLDDQAGEP